MRTMGIDYGSKRIGIATSDERGDMAFPYSVLESPKELVKEIVALAKVNGIQHFVIGASLDSGGRENDIMKNIRRFGEKLEAKGFTVVYEPEFFSSVEATRFQGKNKFTDASAAAIILQRYLDKTQGKG